MHGKASGRDWRQQGGVRQSTKRKEEKTRYLVEVNTRWTGHVTYVAPEQDSLHRSSSTHFLDLGDAAHTMSGVLAWYI